MGYASALAFCVSRGVVSEEIHTIQSIVSVVSAVFCVFHLTSPVPAVSCKRIPCGAETVPVNLISGCGQKFSAGVLFPEEVSPAHCMVSFVFPDVQTRSQGVWLQLCMGSALFHGCPVLDVPSQAGKPSSARVPPSTRRTQVCVPCVRRDRQAASSSPRRAAVVPLVRPSLHSAVQVAANILLDRLSPPRPGDFLACAGAYPKSALALVVWRSFFFSFWHLSSFGFSHL